MAILKIFMASRSSRYAGNCPCLLKKLIEGLPSFCSFEKNYISFRETLYLLEEQDNLQPPLQPRPEFKGFMSSSKFKFCDAAFLRKVIDAGTIELTIPGYVEVPVRKLTAGNAARRMGT